ncbi:TPA: NAD(P)-dependent oxidoreductase [Vibrio harveyi]|nr:NAD(P)-dependent oxidoreductase [Vibrio harveyi]HDM8180697.1 NAD(P)-dependent oxidoreductase [Vibrio harveyi]
MKVIIVGANGFIGSHVKKCMLNDSIDVFQIDRNTNIDSISGEYDLLIDATSQKRVSEISPLIDKIEMICDNARVKKIVVLSSFSTLQSAVKSPSEINFGSKIDIYTPYTEIKSYKERAYLKSNVSSHICFLYLPIILGEGGIWNSIFSSRKFNRFVPKLENVYAIEVSNIANAIISIYNSRLTRALAYGKYCWDDLFETKSLQEISIDELGVAKHLKLLFNNHYLSYVGYTISLLYMKLRFNNYTPSLFYWFVFFKQDTISESFIEYNVLEENNCD